MKVTEQPIAVSLEPPYDTQYLELMNEYFAASERNNRASSIEEKKLLMAIKEQMALLCNRNPQKLDAMKQVIGTVRGNREKIIVISKSNAVAIELYETLSADAEDKSVLIITNNLSIHEVNRIQDQFNKIPESTVLIVTDAVNTGLDLTAANHLAHYDYPARYPDILQRNNRISRQTSQHSEATMYYLTTAGKIDEFDYGECMLEKARNERAIPSV